MTETTDDRLRRVAAAVFRLPLEGVAADLREGETPGWDSVGQLMLMLAVEEEFGVTFPVEDLTRLRGLPEIGAYLEGRTAS
ncbi:MAG TPA: acyl carrier protein [Thermoanaerobaculia bacterium]|nr:acyl carrier protein [Thermoanaerobaculia bacterium]